MHNRIVAAVAALVFFSSAGPADARTIFPAFGGPGSSSFDDHCPAHNFLIGLAGHAGSWIDRVRIVCATISPNGTHGTKYYGPEHGGGGGTVLESSCPPDSVVHGVRLWTSEFEHQRVSQVLLMCAVRCEPDRQSTVRFAGSGAVNEGGIAYQECVTGELGSGFNGHYGADVNALRLDCAVRMR